jgi:hypothetical protein
MPASKRNEKLKCHVPNCSQRAGIGDIVLVSENEAMKPCSQTDHFYSGLDRVGPLGAEIEITHFLETDENKRIKNNTFKSCAEATEPVGNRGEKSITERNNTSGNPSGHFFTRFINSTCPPPAPRSWTALLTQTMSILSNGYGGDSFTESIDNVLDDSNPDQNVESYTILPHPVLLQSWLTVLCRVYLSHHHPARVRLRQVRERQTQV